MQYYITYRQLFFLLSGSGIECLYGIRPVNMSEILSDFQKKDNIYRDMIELYQLGIISWEKDKIRINEPFYSFMSILRQAEQCLECTNSRETAVLYQGDDAFLWVCPSPNDKNRIVIRRISGQDIYQELGLDILERMGIFPEPTGVGNAIHEDSVRPEVLMSFNVRHARSGDRIWDVYVIASGIYTYLKICEKEKTRTVALNRTNINKLLFAGRNI